MLALLAVGCGGGEPAARPDPAGVIKLRVDLEDLEQPNCGDPSCILVEHVEWVAPEQGWWRRETEDGSGYRTTSVFARGMYSNNGEVRIGSPEFVGATRRAPASLAALLRREVAVGDLLMLPCGERSCTFRVEETMPLDDADDLGIFDIEVTESTMLQRELSVGAPPTVPVKAYWFGPELAGREAFASVEMTTDHAGIAHVTFYGDPAEIAAGKTHAYAGREVPEHELQVVSRPVSSVMAKELARVRAGRGVAVTLPSGERVTVFRRAVLTDSTLVAVGGRRVDLRRFATSLRPL